MPSRLERKQVQYMGIGTPAANPPAGQFFLYFKADENLYCKNSAGVETLLSGGGVVNNWIPMFSGGLFATNQTFFSNRSSKENQL